MNSPKKRAELRAILRKLDAVHFAVMEHRYYPTMINLEGGSFVMK